MSERYVLSDNGFVADMGYTLNGEGEEVMADEIVKRLNALEAKLEAMRNAAAIAIVALAHYSTSDNELDNVREMLEGAVAAAQEEKQDEQAER